MCVTDVRISQETLYIMRDLFKIYVMLIMLGSKL